MYKGTWLTWQKYEPTDNIKIYIKDIIVKVRDIGFLLSLWSFNIVWDTLAVAKRP